MALDLLDCLPASAILHNIWASSVLLIILLYTLLASHLRYARQRSTLEAFPYKTRQSFAQMTDNDAFEIQLIIMQLEFPFTFYKAIQFALFRTYGIPSISKVLVATSQLSDVATASKRYADTAALLREFLSHRPSSPRTLEAIARMNYIHSLYQQSGAISNDDMLFTLSLFVLEPCRWIERYEWRALKDFEKCSLAVFWKSIGDAMGISYRRLESAEEGWVDGVHWLEELQAWSEQYERKKMLPHPDNKRNADETVAILLWGIPKSLKSFGKRVVSALMDDRLREAMMYEKPSESYYTLLACIFGLRKFLLRYVSPPRPSFLRKDYLEKLSADGRSFFRGWEGPPYYVRPTFLRRWGPEAWASRLQGLPVPGDEGEKYHSRGYKIPEIGPRIAAGKGTEKARETVARLQETRTGGCPFGTVKAS
ncbi:MAG: hypothetical protein Q9185_002139 [Variospora sp. 1 TL-2023]